MGTVHTQKTMGRCSTYPGNFYITFLVSSTEKTEEKYTSFHPQVQSSYNGNSQIQVVYAVANDGKRLEIPEGPLGKLIAGNFH